MFRSAIFGAACAILSCGPVWSQGLGDVVTADVLTGWRGDDGRHMAAVRLTLEPGWKTYWRAPGDAGIPPRFDWGRTGNLSGVAIHWPVPEVFRQNGMRSVGYGDVVTIPLELRATDPGAPIRLDADLEIGVCEDVCVPVSLRLRGELSATAGSGGDEIRSALKSGPISAQAAGVGQVVCRTEPIGDGIRVSLIFDMPPLGGDEDVVVELADRSIWVSEPETRRNGRTVTAVAEMVPPSAKPFAMARKDVRITVIGGGKAVDIRGCTGG